MKQINGNIVSFSQRFKINLLFFQYFKHSEYQLEESSQVDFILKNFFSINFAYFLLILLLTY